MKKLKAIHDITLRLLQTGEQYSFKKDEMIDAGGILAERLVKQSKGAVIWVDYDDSELLEKELEAMNLKDLLAVQAYSKIADEKFPDEKPTKKQLIAAILEVRGAKNES